MFWSEIHVFFCRDALDIAGMSDIAQDAADKIQDDFMDKMEMFALYYVGKFDHLEKHSWSSIFHRVFDTLFSSGSSLYFVFFFSISVNSRAYRFRV